MVVAVVGLAISTGMVWAEQRRTAEQKGLVEAQRSLAEANLKLFRQLSGDLMRIGDQGLSPIRGTERARAEIFDTSLRTYRAFLQQTPKDPTIRKETAQIARFSANVHRMLDEPKIADPLYRESIVHHELLAEQSPGELSFRADLAMVQGDYAQLLARLGRLREAAERARQAVRAAEPLAALFPDRPEPGRVLAKTLYDRASIEGQMGRPAESAGLIEQAIGLYEDLLKLKEPQSNVIDPLMMGSSMHALAVARRELRQAEEGLAAVDRGLALMRSTLDKDANDNNAEHNLDRLLLERARISMGLDGRRDQAMGDLDRAIDSWGRLSTGYPLVVNYRESLAVARQVRGALRAGSGLLEPADEDLEASRQGLESLANMSPEIPSYRANLGRTYLEQGRLARRAGNADRAIDRLEKAVRMLEGVIDQTPENGRDRTSMEAARDELAALIRGKTPVSERSGDLSRESRRTQFGGQ
jgi:tetratricopeptide (TPR) repeat protein